MVNFDAVTLANSTANITPKALTVTGSSAANKVYDGNNSATLSGGTLVGVVNSDTVILTQGGTFASTNVANGIVVNVSDSLSGAAAGNYSLNPVTGVTANITAPPSPAPAPVPDQSPIGVVGFGITSGDTATRSSMNSQTPTIGDRTTVTVSHDTVQSGDETIQVRLGQHALEMGVFEVELPAQVEESLRNQTSAPTATLPDGQALPAWLAFDPVRFRFSSIALPEGALPLKVLISSGSVTIWVDIR